MSPSNQLRRLVKQGQLDRVRELLASRQPSGDIGIDACDSTGYTPLMHAVASPKASVGLVRLLLEFGADVHRESLLPYGGSYTVSVLSSCLAGGDPEKLAVLLEHGANLHYKRAGDYDALIDAVTGRDVLRDPRLIDLLNLLVAARVSLNGVSSYGESGLRVLSRAGRFDGVRLLLASGADETQLGWTPLIRAVATGSLADVEKAIANGAPLEARDWWERTAFLVAVQTGDLAKAQLLLRQGADASACGRCGKPPLFYAIENYRAPMLQWLLETGASVDRTNEHGETVLVVAVECGNAEAVDVLLKAGADVNARAGTTCPPELADVLARAGVGLNAERFGQTALASAGTRDIALRLLDAGADPADLSSEARRAIVGLDPEAGEDLLDASPEDYRKGRSPRFGTCNPEEIHEPFWDGMIRAGIGAYQADTLYPDEPGGAPVWCAQRFGQSLTMLPDGRIVQIGGEHEDSYDEDFCIYNDVFVHLPGGTIRIYGYPESVFPPTGFHTATLIGDSIYIIGSLGYQGTRQYGTTPVYRLDTKTFRIEPVPARSESPGWISKHRAALVAPHQIRISGGKLLGWDGERETDTRNEKAFVLDIERQLWRRD